VLLGFRLGIDISSEGGFGGYEKISERGRLRALQGQK